MSKLIEIPITKAILVLSEDELVNSIPKEVYVKGLKRGKVVIRKRQHQVRSEQKRVAEKKQGY